MKIVKRIFLFLLALIVIAVAFEAKNWGYWYTMLRFKIVGFEPLTTATETRVLLEKVPGADTLSDDTLVMGEAAPFNLDEVLSYSEEMKSDSLIVWHDGEIKIEKYWNNLDRSVRPDTASMHKSVMGMLFALAVGEGKLSVDEPVGNYFREWKDDPRGNIPIRDFLTMSAGFAPMDDEGGVFSEAQQFSFGRNVRKHVANMEPIAAPGEMYYYRNAVSQVAGYVLSAAIDQPYQDYLSEKLWAPIGADDAYVWLNGFGDIPRTYSSLLARPIDWLKLGLLLKNDGRVGDRQVLPAAPLNDMLSPSAANPNYGWQIWLGTEWENPRYYTDEKTGFAVKTTEPFKTDDMIYFDGFGGQRVYVSKAYDLVIVRTGAVNFEWDDSYVPNILISQIEALRTSQEDQSEPEAIEQ